MGHTPNVHPAGRYGASKHQLSVDAFKNPHVIFPNNTAPNSHDSQYRRGFDVVGYTGFVPGKNAGNVFGQTFSQSNFATQNLYRQS